MELLSQRRWNTAKSSLVFPLGLFLFSFVMASGLTGSWLIAQQNLLFRFHFEWYGMFGKIVLFFCFLYILRSHVVLKGFHDVSWHRTQYFWWMLFILSLVTFFYSANALTTLPSNNQSLPFIALSHLSLWLIGLSSFFGSFSVETIREIWKRTRQHIIYSGLTSLGVLLVFDRVFTFWPLLSNLILQAEVQLLRPLVTEVKIVPPLTIQLPQFAITVGEYCSGIESLFLLTVLYILIGQTEWHRLKKTHFALLYIPLILGVFVLNIMRVFIIILSGMYLSPAIAAKLFHTYLGMLLFMGYFFVFLKLGLPHIIKRSSVKGETV